MLADTVDSDFEGARLRSALKAKLFGQAVSPPRVGRYRLGSPVGEGAMGAVYRAHDPELDRTVALKILRASAGSGAEPRLVREGQTLARLNHPNVITVYEIGREGDRLFIAMELVDGESLLEWSKTTPPGAARFQELLRHAVAAADGLAAAHAAGVVHRDFKPSNVLLESGGRLRVADFGLARDLEQPDVSYSALASTHGGSIVDERITATGNFVGTPAYMAPEQFEGRTDAGTDQFSFCATFFELLYGRRPYPGTTIAELIAAHAQGPRGNVRARGVPRWIRAVLVRGLDPDPARRFASMHALRGALVRGDRRARRRPFVVWGVAAAVLAAGAWWSSIQPRSCTLGRDEIEAAWGPARRATVHDAFVAVDTVYAVSAGTRVRDTLDDFSRDWEASRLQACEAAVGSAEDTAKLSCLRRAAVALDELTAALTDVDADASQRAPEAALAFSDGHGCEHPQDYGEGDGAWRSMQLGRAIAAARANSALGRWAEADALAREAVAQAKRRQLHRVHADGAIVLAALERQRGSLRSSARWAEQALESAESVQALALQALAWHQLAHAARRSDNLERAAFALRRADSALRRLGDAPALAQSLAWTHALVLGDQGDYAAALAQYEAAYELWDGNAVTRAGILCDLGDLQETRGELATARANKQRCLSEYEAVYGEASPKLALPLASLGKTVMREGDLTGAAALYRRADDMFALAPSVPGGGLPGHSDRLVLLIERLSGRRSGNTMVQVRLPRGARAAPVLRDGFHGLEMSRITRVIFIVSVLAAGVCLLSAAMTGSPSALAPSCAARELRPVSLHLPHDLTPLPQVAEEQAAEPLPLPPFSADAPVAIEPLPDVTPRRDVPKSLPEVRDEAPTRLPPLPPGERSDDSAAPTPLPTVDDRADPPASSLPRRSDEATSPDESLTSAPAPDVAKDRARMAAAHRLATEHVQKGFALANRAAIFSARGEFIEALKQLTSGACGGEEARRRSAALAEGLRALDEADDFVSPGTLVENDLELPILVSAHRTPLLQGADLDALTITEARESYYAFAHERLASAIVSGRAGSMALYGLGRLETRLGETSAQRHPAANHKAIALQRSALSVEPGNYLAANELGVLLARLGQYEEARTALTHSVRLHPEPTTWRNLATVNERLGDRLLAQQARGEAVALIRATQRPAGRVAGSGVRWTNPGEFARRTSHGSIR